MIEVKESEVSYRVDELIKCCDQYPVYRQAKKIIWVECECCRKRTVNVFDDRNEAGRVWNELMLRVRNPRTTPQGKQAILSLVDEQDKSHGEVGAILGIPANTVTKLISRLREEYE